MHPHNHVTVCCNYTSGCDLCCVVSGGKSIWGGGALNKSWDVQAVKSAPADSSFCTSLLLFPPCVLGFLGRCFHHCPITGYTSLLPSFCDLLEQTTDFLSSGTFPMLCSLPDMQIRLEYFPLQVTKKKKKSNSMQFKQTVAMKLIGTFTWKSQGLIDGFRIHKLSIAMSFVLATHTVIEGQGWQKCTDRTGLHYTGLASVFIDRIHKFLGGLWSLG